MSTLITDRFDKRTHIPELDGIRGIAVLVVMAMHFFAAQIDAPRNAVERLAEAVTGYGMWGVDLFFVLSGYLITGILYNSLGSKKYFTSFYMRRTLRIFPLYYGVIFVLVFLIPQGVIESYVPDLVEVRAVQPWLWSYLTNVYVAKEGSFSSIPYVSHFWSLAVEEHFYLFWPLVVWLVRRETVIFIAIALSLLALASRIFLAFTTSNDMWAQVFTLSVLDRLCIGSAFALWVRGPEGWGALRRAIKFLPIVAGLLVTLMAIEFHGVLHKVALSIKEFLLAILFATFVTTAAWPSGWQPMRVALRWPPLMMMGKYSYGLYVFHVIVAYYFGTHLGAEYFARFAGSLTGGLFLQAFVGSVLSFLMAVVSYHIYEAPFLKCKRLFRAL